MRDVGWTPACPSGYSPWQGAPGCRAGVQPMSPASVCLPPSPLLWAALSSSEPAPTPPAAPPVLSPPAALSRGSWGAGGARARWDAGGVERAPHNHFQSRCEAWAQAWQRRWWLPPLHQPGTLLSGIHLADGASSLRCSRAASRHTTASLHPVSHHCGRRPGFLGLWHPSAGHTEVCPSASVTSLTAGSSHAAAWHDTSTLPTATVSTRLSHALPGNWALPPAAAGRPSGTRRGCQAPLRLVVATHVFPAHGCAVAPALVRAHPWHE